MTGRHKIHEFLELNSLKLFSRTTGNLFFAMVSVIEVDSEDGDQVRGLSVDLMEGAESLFNEINGPRSFQPMWVVDD